jgi:hypothetical protein
MRKRVRVVYVPVGEAPRTIAIDNTLEALQKLVGGYVQAVPLADSVDIMCNEEGLVLGLPFNRIYGPHAFHGNFFISRVDRNGKTISLTDDDIDQYTHLFAKA